MKHLLFFLALATAAPLSAQELLEIDTLLRCNYTGWLEEELYSFEAVPPVPEMVDRILKATQTPRNFVLLLSNVESVAAVLSGGKRYLLYSQDFYLRLPQSERASAFGLLAHEIGHHAAEHTFDPAFREKEELEADAFMGFALFKLGAVNRLALALEVPEKVPFSHAVSPILRREAIERGWRRSDVHVQVQENMAYDGSTDATSIPIPHFPWPPPQCAQRTTLSERLQASARTLSEVDGRLRQALSLRGYSQRSYFQTPNGFALVTQMEQFVADGASKSGTYRWADYPAPENFDGLWSYLKSLVMPTPGYFRVFVFVVTDTPYSQAQRRVGKEEAVGWLSQGLNRLPSEIGSRALNERHYLDVLVYEFQAPQSTRICAQKCPCLLGSDVHLQKSGLGRMGF
jgi:hypothetical protein